MSASLLDEPDPQSESKSLDAKSKARDLMLEGRLSNQGTKFSQAAFDSLSKATKLDPYLVEAWLELAECYQRKSDISGAISCLENALKYSDKPNKVVLRQLSACIRQKQFDTQEAKIAALLRSLELSKQALRSDLYDEESYYNLAKAYMCLFFATECVDLQLISLSRAAYSKAWTLSNSNLAKKEEQEAASELDETLDSKLSIIENNAAAKPFIEQSDFLFNYSTVLVYFQDFEKALEYLRAAIRLDPEWPEPRDLEEGLLDYLKQIQRMLNELGKNSKLVVKRYGKVVESLKIVEKIENLIRLDQRRLSKSETLDVRALTLDQLKSNKRQQDTQLGPVDGANVDGDVVIELLHLKLVSIVNYNQAMYLTFIAIDQNYSLTVVTIYNLAAARCPSSKDVVTIVEPKIEEISVGNLCIKSGVDSRVSYKRIDVREFRGFYVNGHRISIDQVSKPQFRVSVLP